MRHSLIGGQSRRVIFLWLCFDDRLRFPHTCAVTGAARSQAKRRTEHPFFLHALPVSSV